MSRSVFWKIIVHQYWKCYLMSSKTFKLQSMCECSMIEYFQLVIMRVIKVTFGILEYGQLLIFQFWNTLYVGWYLEKSFKTMKTNQTFAPRPHCRFIGSLRNVLKFAETKNFAAERRHFDAGPPRNSSFRVVFVVAQTLYCRFMESYWHARTHGTTAWHVSPKINYTGNQTENQFPALLYTF